MISLFISSTAYAGTIPLPPELLYKGQPVEPYCMADFAGDASTREVDLAKCNPKEVIRDKLEVREDGSRGYEYHEPDEHEPMGNPYVYYRYLGMVDGNAAVLIENSGGGTGHFSNLMLLKRDGDKLIDVKDIAGGDRCNGGLSDESVKDGQLYYSEALTPFDFIALAQDNPNNLKAYDDLEASAASCIGTANYQDGALISVKIDEGAGEDQEGWTEKYPYQACFNKLLRDYIKEGKTTFTPALLKVFTHAFNAQCNAPVKKPADE